MLRKLFFLALVLGGSARGEFLRTPYPGARPTGMGNAFLAISDDNNALWYNPAGLARVKNYHFSLLDASLAFDSEDTFNRLNNAIFKGDTANLVRPDTQYHRYNVRPTLLMPYFSLAFFSHGNSFVQLRNLDDLNARIDLFAFNDIGAAAGVGLPLGPYVSFGATFRAFQRTGIDANLTGADLLLALGLPLTVPSQQQVLNAAYSELAKTAGLGLGLGLDVGTQITIPMPKGYPKWTLAAVVNDLGQTTFLPFAGYAAPKRVNTSIHFGTAVQYDLGKWGQLNLAADYRNAFEAVPFVKQTNVGIEWRHRFFALRGGLSQGYPTGGISLEFPPSTRVHFSTYSAELGSRLWESEYRIFLFQVSIGFNPS